jgi:tetrahydromethanopterin S-methyltransferase subunit A
LITRDAFPEIGSGLDLCPTDEPAERHGWPPLPGDYHVVRYQAPVAVCALNSTSVAQQLSEHAPEGLAIVGTLHTENLGIGRIIRNTLANPNIRFLILCGADTQQAIGHLPGQSLQSLFENGVDERGRIRGARGKRPVLKNVSNGRDPGVCGAGRTNPNDRRGKEYGNQ